MSLPARHLLQGQVGFFVCLALCALIDPAGLNDNHGWSYYGGRYATILPYFLGFVFLVVLIVRVASLLEEGDAGERPSTSSPGLTPRQLAGALRVLAVLLLIDLGTPDTVGAVLYWAHDVASTLLFAYQFGLGVLLAWKVVPGKLGFTLVGVQFAGGIVAMFSQLQLLPLLGFGIFVFQVSFGVLLVVATERVVRAMAAAPESLGPGQLAADVSSGH